MVSLNEDTKMKKFSFASVNMVGGNHHSWSFFSLCEFQWWKRL